MFEKVNYPEELGVSSKGLLDFIDAVEREHIDIHSAILLRHGKEVCRMNWQPYGIDRPHMLFSLSKSFTSCAAGFAVAEGLLNYDSKVSEVLSDKLPENPSERLLKITLDDLLCMSSGLDPASDNAPAGFDVDWAASTLSYEVTDEPGTRFNYNSMGTYLVSAMVTRVTGMTCRDYLAPRLFDKLGIATPDWDCSPQRINCGGWGLHLSCEDIAKFGQLLLQKGMWNGERILPDGWVELATRKHIDNSGRGAHVDWEQGYGYQFWRCREGRYRGDGMCGQYCLVSESEDAVLAMTAGVLSMDNQMDAIHDHLLAAIDAEPASDADKAALKARLSTLSYAWPTDDGSAPDITGVWQAESGGTLTVERTDDGLRFTHNTLPGMNVSYVCGIGTPVDGEMSLRMLSTAPAEKVRAQCGGDNGRLIAQMRYLNGPFERRDEFELKAGVLTDKFSGAGMGAGIIKYSPLTAE